LREVKSQKKEKKVPPRGKSRLLLRKRLDEGKRGGGRLSSMEGSLLRTQTKKREKGGHLSAEKKRKGEGEATLRSRDAKGGKRDCR